MGLQVHETRTKFTFDNKKGNRDLGATRKKIAGVEKSLLGLGSIIGTAGLAVMAKQSLDFAEAQGQVSQKLGVSTKFLQGFRIEAEKSAGMMSGAADVGLQRFIRRLAEAANGTGEAQGAIRDLGLEAKDLQALGSEKALLTVIDRLNKLDDAGERIRLGFKLFDTEGVALVNATADGISRAADDAERFGTAMTDLDIQAAADANAALIDAREAGRGLVTQLTLSAAPALASMADSGAELLRDANGFEDAMDGAAFFVDSMVIGFNTIAFGLQTVGTLGAAAAAEVSIEAEKIAAVVAKSPIEAIASVSPLVGALRGLNEIGLKLDETFGKIGLGRNIVVDPKDVADVADVVHAAGQDVVDDNKGVFDQIAENSAKFLADQNALLAEHTKRRDARRAGRVRSDDGGVPPVRTAGAELVQTGAFEDPLGQAIAAEKARLEKKKQILIDGFRSEQLIIIDESRKKFELINQLEERGYFSEQEATLQRLQLARDREQALTDISKKGADDRTAQTRAENSRKLDITAQYRQASVTLTRVAADKFIKDDKKRFKINKVASHAEVGINTAVGISKAWKDLPWYAALPLTVLIAASGLAQGAAIDSATYEGGGSITTPSGSAPASQPNGGFVPQPDTQDQRFPGGVTVIIQGNVLGNKEFAVDIVQTINDLQGNNNVLFDQQAAA